MHVKMINIEDNILLRPNLLNQLNIQMISNLLWIENTMMMLNFTYFG